MSSLPPIAALFRHPVSGSESIGWKVLHTFAHLAQLHARLHALQQHAPSHALLLHVPPNYTEAHSANQSPLHPWQGGRHIPLKLPYKARGSDARGVTTVTPSHLYNVYARFNSSAQASKTSRCFSASRPSPHSFGHHS